MPLERRRLAASIPAGCATVHSCGSLDDTGFKETLCVVL
jgi:hypothetical protein